MMEGQREGGKEGGRQARRDGGREEGIYILTILSDFFSLHETNSSDFWGVKFLLLSLTFIILFLQHHVKKATVTLTSPFWRSGN